MELEKFSYDNEIVRKFTLATVIWGLVGMLVGLIIATQLYVPALNLQYSLFNFRQDKTTSYKCSDFCICGQRNFYGHLLFPAKIVKARMFSDMLSKIHFWGWQMIIVAAAVTFPLGITTSKEYAELEWPIDIAIALVWVAFGINMFGTIIKRREKHMYVAIWFYIATGLQLLFFTLSIQSKFRLLF